MADLQGVRGGDAPLGVHAQQLLEELQRPRRMCQFLFVSRTSSHDQHSRHVKRNALTMVLMRICRTWHIRELAKLTGIHEGKKCTSRKTFFFHLPRNMLAASLLLQHSRRHGGQYAQVKHGSLRLNTPNILRNWQTNYRARSFSANACKALQR